MTKCNTCGGTTVFISGSIVKCEYCGRLYSTTNGEFSLADPERLYSSAVSMSKSQNEETLKLAIETFEALGSYKDSFALANSCRGMIAQSRVEAEERRLAAERQAEFERIESEKRAFEEKQKAKVRGFVIAVVSAVAVIAVIIGVISNSNKSSSYNQAMELYSKGQYEEAREIFNDLGDYSDAATYVSTIDSFLTERESKYEKGVAYYEKGAYSECITLLVDISDYLDSADYIEKSAEAIYQQATDYYNSGNFEKAKELLAKIPNSYSKAMDVELLLADIETIIIEQTNAANYAQARGCYDNGDYETAQRLFMSLGNYEDSATYLSAIGTSYYKHAMDLFNQKQYVSCGEVLQYIDTGEEWTDYSLAVELRQNVSNVYVNTIREEAKNICRREGYNSMVEYINNSKCCILTDDTAQVLMQECEIKIISLRELQPYVTGDYELGEAYNSEENRTDTMGNVYSYALRGTKGPSYGEVSNTYCINQQYAIFSATVAVRQGASSDNSGIIRIYGDGRLLWSDENIRKDTKPYNIEIDISGITDLKIEMYYRGGLAALLCDPMLSE